MQEVIALSKGYLGSLREVGEVFEVEDGVKASWFVPVGTAGQAPEDKPKAKTAKQ